MPTDLPVKWKVLSTMDISHCPQAFDLLKEQTDFTYMTADQEKLKEVINDYDIYISTLGVRVTKEMLDRQGRLKVIATPSTGTDHIDCAAAEANGITVLSLKKETKFLDRITATAELTWGLLLSVVRNIPTAFEAAKQGRWARDEFRGRQLSGKTLGILGYGRLGRIVADYGQAFRMKVLVNDVKSINSSPGIEVVDLDTLLKESDVLSIHIHLTDENKQFINATAFQKMKKSAVLINTSRGGIVDEQALIEALSSGQLAGAGVDVIDGEWDTDLANHPMIRYAKDHNNLIITPHIGGVAHEAQSMVFEFLAEKIMEHITKS